MTYGEGSEPPSWPQGQPQPQYPPNSAPAFPQSAPHSSAPPYPQSPAAPGYGPPPTGYGPPPVHGQQPGYGQPPPAQPHSMQVQQSTEARGAPAARGQRALIFGLIWIAAGAGITICTYASDIPVYFVAWGPVVYGVIQVVRGIKEMNAGKS